LLPRKGADKSDLADLRRDICATVLTGPTRIIEFDMPVRTDKKEYLTAVNEWHDAIASIWKDLIAEHLPGENQQNNNVALMVWGDPSLYDSTLRIAVRLGASGMPLNVQVVPGITSVQVLTAAHGIPLNTLAEPVLITTGRRLRESGWPDKTDTVVVMLDSGGAFSALDPAGIEIWWGAYLGMPHQALISGALNDVAETILVQRAALKEKHGWIMDVYLLRRQH
jgi:precorrin-6A synthase